MDGLACLLESWQHIIAYCSLRSSTPSIALERTRCGTKNKRVVLLVCVGQRFWVISTPALLLERCLCLLSPLLQRINMETVCIDCIWLYSIPAAVTKCGHGLHASRARNHHGGDINKYCESITLSHAKHKISGKEIHLYGKNERTKWSLRAHLPTIQIRNIFHPIIIPSHPLSMSFHPVHTKENLIRCSLSLRHRYRCSSSEIQLSCRSSAWKADKKSGTHVPDTGHHGALEAVSFD